MKSLCVLGTIGFALLVLLWSCYQKEVPTAFYKDRGEAASDGAMSRGWIPEFLPNSATNICEQHDIDTNRGAIAFSASPQELRTLKATLEPVNTTIPSSDALGPWFVPTFEQWPTYLRRKNVHMLVKNGFNICKKVDTRTSTVWYIALNLNQGIAFTWH